MSSVRDLYEILARVPRQCFRSLANYLFWRMQCCRQSLGTDMRRREFFTPVGDGPWAAAGEKRRGRNESDPVANGSGVAVVSKPS